MIFALRFMIEEEPIINCKARDILVSWVEKFRFFSFMKILEKEFRKRGVENSSTIRTFLHASTTFNTNFGITHDLFFQFNGFNGTNFDAVLTLCTQCQHCIEICPLYTGNFLSHPKPAILLCQYIDLVAL